MPSTTKPLRIETSEWTCIELSGDDREEWLQGQATNDVRLLKPGNRLSFCFCEPTGGLLAVLDAWAIEDRILLTTARELDAAILDRVERMTILEDVAAAVSPLRLISIQDSGEALNDLLVLPSADAGAVEIQGQRGYALRSHRTPSGGWDLWLPGNLADAVAARFETMPLEAYEAKRLLGGIPKWGVDMGPKTLPPELGQDFEARHISYQKGCYTGQEVLMRINSRGHTNRTWVGLTSNEALPVGATVEHEGKPVGTVSSSSHTDSAGFIAAATLRNEATQKGEVVSVGGIPATVRQMPIGL